MAKETHAHMALAEAIQIDLSLEQTIYTAVVPETFQDIESRRKASQFIGACLASREVEQFDAEASGTLQPIESLYDAIKLAAEGNSGARRMVSINVATDVIERTTKSGHVMQVELIADEAGRIQQHGQYMESVQANSLRYASGSPQMLARTMAEATNSFRLSDRYNDGTLEDYFFVVVSRAADDMSESAMKEAGFFTDTMSVALQVTAATGVKLTTESAFVAGKRSPLEERCDAGVIAKMGDRLGVNLAYKSATELLATPLLIHKSLMPRGVMDLVELYDDCAGGTFFGETKPSQDYDGYRELCREREARFEPKVNSITDRLIAESATIVSRVHAVERLHQLSQEEMVVQAVFDDSISPNVFGPAASHIIEARIYYEQGDAAGTIMQLRRAQKTATSSSCPSGKNTEAEQSETTNESGDCEFVSKECPKCHAKNVRTKVSRGRITGECGCSAKIKKA